MSGPYPRRILCRACRPKLAGAGAQDIVFDVDFSAASNPEDDALVCARDRAGWQCQPGGLSPGGLRAVR